MTSYGRLESKDLQPAFFILSTLSLRGEHSYHKKTYGIRTHNRRQ